MKSRVAVNVETKNARTYTCPGCPAWNPAVRPSPICVGSLIPIFCDSFIRLSPLYPLPTPTDEDTVQYLCNTLPAGPRYGAQAFRDALDVARLRHPTMPFDERVQEALTSLGLR